MADTLTNISITAETWLELYELSSITPGFRIDVQNIGAGTLYYSRSPTEPDINSDKYRILKRGSSIYLSDGDLKVWMFSPHINGLINVALFSFNAATEFPSNYFAEVSLGNVPGQRIITVSGRNPMISATPADIWEIGGPITHIVQPGIQLEIFSRDAADTFDGIGAQELTIHYLDNNYIEQSEVVETNGGVKALTATNVLRFFRAEVTRTGSSFNNVGDIDIRPEGGIEDCLDAILAGTNLSGSTFFTIPADHKGYIISYFASVGKNTDANVSVLVTRGDSSIFLLARVVDIYQQFKAILLETYVELPEKSDIKMAASNSGGGTAIVRAGYKVWLVEDNA